MNIRVNPALKHVKEVLETTDTKKVAQLLSTGEWIAIYAIENDPVLFVMGRINLHHSA